MRKPLKDATAESIDGLRLIALRFKVGNKGEAIHTSILQ